MLCLLYAVLLWFASKFALQAFGEKPHTTQTLALCVFGAFFCASPKLFRRALLPLAIAVGLYAPVGYMYGKPSYQFIVSLLAATASEASEFFSQYSLSAIAKGAAIPILSVLAHATARKAEILPWRNKTFVLAAAAILIVCGRPTPFFDTLRNALLEADADNKELLRLMKQSAWTGVSSSSPVQDYVLVIGESVRRDYLGLYGYPLSNTPFLSGDRRVTAVEGLTAGAPYTAGSLRLMLTQADAQAWAPRYDLNLISLAKAAGFRTVWLSNQGYSGIDTPVTAIAKHAETTIFATGGDYGDSAASDFTLLPLLKSTLAEEAQGPRLIVLHTIGSHSNACKRVKDMENVYVPEDPAYEEPACYLSSIRKADRFLEKAVKALEAHQAATGRPFSLVWFSDHGQRQISEEGRRKLRHSDGVIPSYEVPLVRIDSSAKAPQRLKSFKSGLLFTCGLAGWLSIRAEGLPRCSLFDGRDDPDFGLKDRLKKAERDPAEIFAVEWKRAQAN